MTASNRQLNEIAHLGRYELLTPKPERSLGYFRDLLGMEVVHSAGHSVYLRGYGDYGAASLKLSAAKAPGIGCISWRAASPEALARRVEALQSAGLGLGWTDADFGRGPAFRFRDPDGHLMELYYEETRYRAPDHLRSALKNMPQKYTGRGVNVRRIDHLALLAREVAPNREFAQRLLGFQLRERVLFQNGSLEIGSWLSPNPIHHQVAYVADVKGGSGRLHHISFWVDFPGDVMRAADVLLENGIFVEAGPSKHNNSQGIYLYSFEPGGNRVEVYCGSFLVLAPDWETITWNEEERGSGVHWGATLPESFLQYATPDIEAERSEGVPEIPAFPVS